MIHLRLSPSWIAAPIRFAMTPASVDPIPALPRGKRTPPVAPTETEQGSFPYPGASVDKTAAASHIYLLVLKSTTTVALRALGNAYRSGNVTALVLPSRLNGCQQNGPASLRQAARMPGRGYIQTVRGRKLIGNIQLPRKFNGPCFSNYRDLDLPRILETFFDFLDHIAR